MYNLERPHEALDQDIPASRYPPSPRPMPDRLPGPEYDEHEIVRRVPLTKDYIGFRGRRWNVPRAFRGETLAIRPLAIDGHHGVFFAANRIATIDLTTKRASAMSPNRCRSCPRAKQQGRA